MSAKDNIITLPNANLRTRSKKVGVINDDIMSLIGDMEAATLSWEDSREHEIGVALAAIQINSLLRIIIVRTDFDNKKDRTFNVLINPEITKLEGDMIEDYEGCLSIHNVYGKIPRYNKVKVKALNKHGKNIRITAEGFLARILQHEIDHTNGIVIIDHIKEKEEAFFILDDDGQLQSLDYNKDIKNNQDLWD
ncbi:MAG: peptide deformylase [Candidatus Saccharimonadales bacterium]